MSTAPDTATRPHASDQDTPFDEHVRRMMAWHFDPGTGSPFWLERRRRLDFDPVRDVRTAADLRRFPDVSAELRDVPAADLIPRGLADRTFQVWESGGTTGAAKRVVDAGYRAGLAAWARGRLVAQGVPESAHWLHLGPTGPHVVGYDTAQYAALGGGLRYAVDLDPRWVKRLIAAGRTDTVQDYLDHLLDQAADVLRDQPVRVLSTTPPLLEAICARPELHELVRERITAIVWAGTSFSAESLRLAEETFFPDAHLVGVYGNSLMGVAPQRPRLPGDKHRCVFAPWSRTTRLELVDEAGELVPRGARGRVRLHLVSEEMLLPNVLERDTAIRVEPAPGDDVDGLADVRTVGAFEGVEVIEGVY